jgi:hypothetical protein
MICRATTATIVDGKTLQSANTEWTDSYRFSGGALFITRKGDREYLYGTLTEVEPRRFVVGYMTILIDNSDKGRMLIVHADTKHPKVIALRCDGRP